MGFACDWLEASYQKWRRASAQNTLFYVIGVLLSAAAIRTLGLVPTLPALGAFSVLLTAGCLLALALWRPGAVDTQRCGIILVLVAECILSGLDSQPAVVVLLFVIYTLLSLSLLSTVIVAGVVSLLHITLIVLLSHPLHNNEMLAGLLVHIWAHLVGIYLNLQHERIARSAFLSARNSVDAEASTQIQSQRLVTVGYARLIGFELALSQCSSLDAARVLKELENRINGLVAAHGCTRITSEGITVICPVPGIDSEHASRICRFALDLEALISSFRDATAADVAVCVGVDSGSITAGVVGTTKWHYDIIGTCVDHAVLLQSSAPSHGVFVTDETRLLLDPKIPLDAVGEYWRLKSIARTTANIFPVNKRYSLVTIPQAINRLLQTISADDQTIKNKKRKPNEEETVVEKAGTNNGSSFMRYDLRFKNEKLEEKFHEEMDNWFIPGLAMSIIFVVLYQAYHFLVMPSLLQSLVLLVIALIVMFGLVIIVYVDYFQSFSQFITRTSGGHSIMILILLLILLLNGIVNSFSCSPQPTDNQFCRLVSFSTISFALWSLTSTVFLRFPSIRLAILHFAVIVVYILQVYMSHPHIGPTEFTVELTHFTHLALLSILILLFSRHVERLLRLDFLSVVKGVEETASKDALIVLNSQALLNIVPSHVAPWVANRGAELWHHAHHSVGVAYLAVSGFDLVGEQGLNGLNFIFSYFDQALQQHRGIEKIKSANRFYVVAVGTMPETSHDVNEAPWTIGELLFTLAKYLLNVTEFAKDKEFEVQIGLDCGSTLAFVPDSDNPQYELWGEASERARLLMQSASQGRILVSEEAYLSLRPRQLNFSHQPIKIISDLNAYILHNGELEEKSYFETIQCDQSVNETARDEGEQMMASMTSSYSSELQSINGGETDSDIEWITPETALMEAVRPVRRNYRNYDYDPYRIPQRPYKGEHAVQYSDWSEHENSRAPSRGRDKTANKRWRAGSRASRTSRASSSRSLRNAFGWLKKGSSIDVDSLADPAERLEAAANRVDKMLAELETYGNFADVKPLEYKPFPTDRFGSIKSIHRAMSSACHTEYDNAESEAALSDAEYVQIRNSVGKSKKNKRRRWQPDDDDADTESQCSSRADRLEAMRWKSAHSVGYENEYEEASDCEGLAMEQMVALSRDIRRNFGDFELATFEDIDRD